MAPHQYDFSVSLFGAGDGVPELAGDIAARLLGERTILLGAAITDEVAGQVIGQMLLLERENPKRQIRLAINSPGGAVTAGLAIYDAMQAVRCDVSTLCLGLAGGISALILAGGAAGKRFALPNARIMLQRGAGGAAGDFTGAMPDLETAAREALLLAGRCREILARHTGQDIETIRRDLERGRFLPAEEARDYELIDQVVSSTAAWLTSG